MTPRFGSVSKAMALVPLAALSAAWTVQVVRAPDAEVSAVADGADHAATGSQAPTPVLPPQTPLVVPPVTQQPASVWGDTKAPVPAPAAIVPAVSSSTTVPPVALAAYQRASTVMNTADPACHLDWTLLGGIGRVESDHGSHAGSRLVPDGHVTPAIIGPALTGAGGTLRVPDTDGGALDGDARFDHAVGPMQFLPATWAVVGVDGDGDGQRDPQDIDDAALAAGVYLCSGTEDLATPAGQRAALLRYNPSASYVTTVLRFAAEYAAGSASTAVTALRVLPVVPAVVLTPQDDPASGSGKKRHRHRHHPVAAGATGSAGAVDPSGSGTSHHGSPTRPPVSTGSTTGPQLQPLDPPAVVPATPAQLADVCEDQVIETYPNATPEAHGEAVVQCVAALDGKTLDEAKAGVAQVVTGLQIDGLTPTPTPEPTTGASETPSETPSAQPSESPTETPSDTPSDTPSTSPSDQPSGTATSEPTSAG